MRITNVCNRSASIGYATTKPLDSSELLCWFANCWVLSSFCCYCFFIAGAVILPFFALPFESMVPVGRNLRPNESD